LQVGHREPRENGSWRRVIDRDVEGYFPAIVSKALWLRTRKANRLTPPSGPKNGLVPLFSGLLVCGTCRGRMVASNPGPGAGGRYAMCANAKEGRCKSGRGWAYEKLEMMLTTLLHRVIRWSTLVPRHQSTYSRTLATLTEHLASLEVERDTNKTRLARL